MQRKAAVEGARKEIEALSRLKAHIAHMVDWRHSISQEFDCKRWRQTRRFRKEVICLWKADKTQVGASFKKTSVIMTAQIFPGNFGHNTLAMFRFRSNMLIRWSNLISFTIEGQMDILSEEER